MRNKTRELTLSYCVPDECSKLPLSVDLHEEVGRWGVNYITCHPKTLHLKQAPNSKLGQFFWQVHLGWSQLHSLKPLALGKPTGNWWAKDGAVGWLVSIAPHPPCFGMLVQNGFSSRKWALWIHRSASVPPHWCWWLRPLPAAELCGRAPGLGQATGRHGQPDTETSGHLPDT